MVLFLCRLVAAVVVTSLATACGDGPRPAPIPGADAPRLSPDLPLAATIWPAEGDTVRAVILAVHGYGGYAAPVFGEAAAVWASAGITTYAYDQRGFGRNASRGAWPGEGALIGDFAAASRVVAAAHPAAPLVAVGCSMGGGVATAAVGEGRAPDVDALVLVAPAIAADAAIGDCRRLAVEALAVAIPDRRWTGDGLVRAEPSDNDDLLRRMAADPVRLPGASLREIRGLARLGDRAAAAAGGVRVPTLVLLGAHDEVMPPGPTASVACRFACPPEIRTYPEGWHLLFGDLQRDRVIADVTAWVLAQADAVRAGAAGEAAGVAP
jgi:alpha-beta hydrolase superfamily lysophospholipase